MAARKRKHSGSGGGSAFKSARTGAWTGVFGTRPTEVIPVPVLAAVAEAPVVVTQQPQPQPPTNELLASTLCAAVKHVRQSKGSMATFVQDYKLEQRVAALALSADLSAGRVAGLPYPRCTAAIMKSAFIYLFQMAAVSSELAEFVIQRAPVACVLGFDCLLEVVHACELLACPSASIAQLARDVLRLCNSSLQDVGRAVEGISIMEEWVRTVPSSSVSISKSMTALQLRDWGNAPTAGGQKQSNALLMGPASYYVPFQAALLAYSGANKVRKDLESIGGGGGGPCLPVLCGGLAHIPNRRQNDGLILRCAIQMLRRDVREAITILRQYIAGDAVDVETVACIAAETETPQPMPQPGQGRRTSSLTCRLPFESRAEAVQAVQRESVSASLYTMSVSSLPILHDARALLEELGVYSATAATTAAGDAKTSHLYADPLARIDRGFLANGGGSGVRLRPESAHLEEDLHAAATAGGDTAIQLVLGAIAGALAPCVLSVALQAATIKDGKALPGQKFNFQRRKFLKEHLAIAGVTPETARDVVLLLARACKPKDKAEEAGDFDLWIWRHQARRGGGGAGVHQSSSPPPQQDLQSFSGRGCRRIRADIPGACAFVPLQSGDTSLAASSTDAIRRVLQTITSRDEAAAVDTLAELFSGMQAPARYSEAVDACTTVGQTAVDIEAADIPLWSRREQFASRACFDCLRHVRAVHGKQRVGHPQVYSCDDSVAVV